MCNSNGKQQNTTKHQVCEPQRRAFGGTLIEFAVVLSICVALLAVFLPIGVPKVLMIEEEIELDQRFVTTGLIAEDLYLGEQSRDDSPIKIDPAGQYSIFGMMYESPHSGGHRALESLPDDSDAKYGILQLLQRLSKERSFAAVLDIGGNTPIVVKNTVLETDGRFSAHVPRECEELLEMKSIELLTPGTGNSLSIPFALGICVETSSGWRAKVKRIATARWQDWPSPYEDYTATSGPDGECYRTNVSAVCTPAPPEQPDFPQTPHS